jgi:hypothetical protein
MLNEDWQCRGAGCGPITVARLFRGGGLDVRPIIDVMPSILRVAIKPPPLKRRATEADQDFALSNSRPWSASAAAAG